MVRRLRPRSGRVGEFVGEYPLGRDAGAAKRGRLCVEILAGGADSGVAEDWFHRPVGLTSCDATDLGQRVVRQAPYPSGGRLAGVKMWPGRLSTSIATFRPHRPISGPRPRLPHQPRGHRAKDPQPHRPPDRDGIPRHSPTRRVISKFTLAHGHSGRHVRPDTVGCSTHPGYFPVRNETARNRPTCTNIFWSGSNMACLVCLVMRQPGDATQTWHDDSPELSPAWAS